jgi:hypothetical protein
MSRDCRSFKVAKRDFVEKETCYKRKRDLLYRQKRPGGH